MNEPSTLQRPGFSIFAPPISSLLVYLTLFPAFASAQLTVVSPGEFATTEAPDAADLTNFPSYRFQQVYGASDFESLGTGPYTITRIDWRPGSEMTETIDYPSDQFLMRFATTNVDPAVEGDIFDRTFENNIHGNEQIVFDGPLTLNTSNAGPAEGPKVFDYGLDLATPYVYDPTDGNLLMDLTVVNGQSPSLLDYSFAPTSTSRFHWTGALGVDSPVSALAEDVGGQWGGHVLQFTVESPQPALTTPFFWDEFSRDTLPTDGINWDPSSAASVTLADGSAVIESLSDDFPGIFVDHPQVNDFSIRAQLRFDGSFSAQINPWIGIWARDETSGDGFSPGGYWGGVGADGILYIGKTLRGLTDNNIRDQVRIMTPAEVRENDIHYQFDAVGDQISVRAWLDGTEMPVEPQLTFTDSEYTLAAMSGIFINPSSNLTGFSVRSFALLPAVEGDFSTNNELDVDDIDLLSQEIRNGGTNRALDLNGDAMVDAADHGRLVTELIGTALGDANLNREVDFADFLALSDSFGGPGGWASGDFDGNGNVEFADFLVLSENFGTAANVAAVPEPAGTFPLWAVAMLFGVLCRRQQLQRGNG